MFLWFFRLTNSAGDAFVFVTSLTVCFCVASIALSLVIRVSASLTFFAGFSKNCSNLLCPLVLVQLALKEISSPQAFSNGYGFSHIFFLTCVGNVLLAFKILFCVHFGF